ncbi:MAG: hypothetical protein II719_01640, partial [Clostridia bacterium]|nr:hypothetical protein [Clostridia bacterium]
MSEQEKLLEQAEAPDPASELPESEEEWKLKEEYRRFGIETDPEESINEVAEFLSTFQETEDNSETDSSNKGKSDLHRTKRLIPILAGAALIGLLLYVFVLAPLLRSAQEETAVPELNTWLKEQVSSGAITQMEYDSLTRDGKVEE